MLAQMMALSDDGSRWAAGSWRLPKRRRLSVSDVNCARRKEHGLETDWRADRHRRLPFRARAHQQRRGRLGVVLVDRLRRRLLDGVGHESRSLRGCLCGLDPVSLGERDVGAPVCVKAAAAASGSLRSALRDLSGVAGAMGRVVRTSAFAWCGVSSSWPSRSSSDC